MKNFEYTIRRLIKERHKIYSQLDFVKYPRLKKVMLKDLKKIDEEIKMWKIRRKYIK